MVIVGSALMVNLRRIWRYRRELMERQSQGRKLSLSLLASLLACRWQRLETLAHRWHAHLFPALAPVPAKV